MLIITAISETANANNHYLTASDLQRNIRNVRFMVFPYVCGYACGNMHV